MKNLWISHEAIEKYGKEYFNNWEADDFWNVDEGFQEDGTYVWIDDMGEIYVAASATDECYTNIKDL